MARVMVLGSGSREHALAWRLSTEGHEVLALPGNAGTAQCGKNLAGRADDVSAVISAAKRERPDLLVVGPEAPLVAGVVDALEAEGFAAFGPSRAAAELERSKAFMKRFLKRHGIPTAPFEVFDDPDAAEAFVRAAHRPLVVKTDGLAAGKGVVVAKTEEEALAAVRAAMRERVFGDAGRTIVIEEVLPGEEASFHVISDGERWLALPAAQDHKRVFDADRGPNTGGMGAYAPAPVVTPELAREIEARVIAPTLRGMRDEGRPFRGVLFVGLMIHDVPVPRGHGGREAPHTEAGGAKAPSAEGGARGAEPLDFKVLEFNVRFGDPEACVLVPLIDGSLYDLLRGDASDVRVREGAALGVVLAAEGYPAKPRTGDVIEGLDAGDMIFHAGTKRDGDRVVTSGGRVLCVTATGADLETARDRAYATVEKIHFAGAHHRSDIGARALGRRA